MINKTDRIQRIGAERHHPNPPEPCALETFRTKAHHCRKPVIDSVKRYSDVRGACPNLPTPKQEASAFSCGPSKRKRPHSSLCSGVGAHPDIGNRCLRSSEILDMLWQTSGGHVAIRLGGDAVYPHTLGSMRFKKWQPISRR